MVRDHPLNFPVATLAYNCVANGCENAAMLDGWADLPRETVFMHVTEAVPA